MSKDHQAGCRHEKRKGSKCKRDEATKKCQRCAKHPIQKHHRLRNGIAVFAGIRNPLTQSANANSTASAGTRSFSLNATRSTTPSRGLTMVCSIFIASMMISA